MQRVVLALGAILLVFSAGNAVAEEPTLHASDPSGPAGTRPVDLAAGQGELVLKDAKDETYCPKGHPIPKTGLPKGGILVGDDKHYIIPLKDGMQKGDLLVVSNAESGDYSSAVGGFPHAQLVQVGGRNEEVKTFCTRGKMLPLGEKQSREVLRLRDAGEAGITEEGRKKALDSVDNWFNSFSSNTSSLNWTKTHSFTTDLRKQVMERCRFGSGTGEVNAYCSQAATFPYAFAPKGSIPALPRGAAALAASDDFYKRIVERRAQGASWENAVHDEVRKLVARSTTMIGGGGDVQFDQFVKNHADQWGTASKAIALAASTGLLRDTALSTVLGFAGDALPISPADLVQGGLTKEGPFQYVGTYISPACMTNRGKRYGELRPVAPPAFAETVPPAPSPVAPPTQPVQAENSPATPAARETASSTGATPSPASATPSPASVTASPASATEARPGRMVERLSRIPVDALQKSVGALVESYRRPASAARSALAPRVLPPRPPHSGSGDTNGAGTASSSPGSRETAAPSNAIVEQLSRIPVEDLRRALVSLAERNQVPASAAEPAVPASQPAADGSGESNVSASESSTPTPQEPSAKTRATMEQLTQIPDNALRKGVGMLLEANRRVTTAVSQRTNAKVLRRTPKRR